MSLRGVEMVNLAERIDHLLRSRILVGKDKISAPEERHFAIRPCRAFHFAVPQRSGLLRCCCIQSVLRSDFSDAWIQMNGVRCGIGVVGIRVALCKRLRNGECAVADIGRAGKGEVIRLVIQHVCVPLHGGGLLCLRRLQNDVRSVVGELLFQHRDDIIRRIGRAVLRRYEERTA